MSEEKVEGSVFHEQRKKLAKEATANKKKKKQILEEWYELRHTGPHPKGGKLILAKKTATGTQREFVGREKEPKLLALVKKLKDNKKLEIVY
jgi:hypothetical protein